MGSYIDIRQQSAAKDRDPRDPLAPPPPLQQRLQQDFASQPQGAQSNFNSLPSEQVSGLIGQLNKGTEELDNPGKAQVNSLSQKAQAIAKSRNMLRPEELQNAMQSILDQAIEFPWETHLIKKGSKPGDIVEEDGMQKLRTPDGSLQPIAYTAKYIADNTVPIGDTGQLAVPLSPKQGYKVVSAKDRDLSSERSEIDKADRGIKKIYDDLSKNFLKGRETKGKDGKVQEPQPFSANEERALNIEAADQYIKQQLQAKNAAQTITDAGVDQLREAIGGRAENPYNQEQEIIDARENIRMNQRAQQAAAAELLQEQGTGQPPVPSASPVPGQEELDPTLAAAAGLGGDSAEERLAKATEYSELKKVQESTVKSGEFASRLVEGGMMQNTLTAPTKNDMKEMYKDSPEGVVVSLPDGRRYLKDDGRFWQIPWDYKQLRSKEMVDPLGEQIIDPSTGDPAAGIVSQLETGGETVKNPYVDEQQGGAGSQFTDNQVAAMQAAGNQISVGRDQAARLNAQEPPQVPEQVQSLQPSQEPVKVDRSKIIQEYDRGTEAEPQKAKKRLSRLMKTPKYFRSLQNPIKLDANQKINEIEVGQAFVTSNGEIWLKLDNGLLDGPFTQQMLSDISRTGTAASINKAKDISINTVF